MQYQLGCVAKSIGLGQTALLHLRPVRLHSSCIRYSSKHQAPRSGISPHVPEGCVDLKNAVIGHAQARPANVTQLYGKMRWPAPTQTQPALYMQMCPVQLITVPDNLAGATERHMISLSTWLWFLATPVLQFPCVVFQNLRHLSLLSHDCRLTGRILSCNKGLSCWET